MVPTWIGAVCLLCTIASAQWIKYPTKDLPRTRDGRPNLSAPAPRTADRKPDLSGMWVIGEELPCPDLIKADNGECAEKMPISQYTADLSKVVPGGLPFTPWSLELMKKRKSEVDPHVQCLPSNFPRLFTLPHITKFVQTPPLLILLNEFNASYRQVFTDGRPLPEDPQPSWNGYSTARWEGDTLVAQTNGFRDDLWLDLAGSPMTSAARVTERFRRPTFGKLEIQATVTDPMAYTRPWTMTVVEKLMVDTELIDEVCLENEKSLQHMKKK
jgi:hypothetical protein